jgi:hypothetical protein
LISSYKEDSTLSRRTIGKAEADELKDIAGLLANLWEAAQRPPEGSERQDAAWASAPGAPPAAALTCALQATSQRLRSQQAFECLRPGVGVLRRNNGTTR